MKDAKKSFLHDLWSVTIGNGVALGSSLLTGLLVPRLLGVYEYGVYKTFTLYLIYTALLHFGFVDGILITFAGKNYDDLNKLKCRTYSQFFIVFQMLLGVILLGFMWTTVESKKGIIIFLAIDTMAVNITSYYQAISQSTLRFKELSLRKVIHAILKILVLFLLYLLITTGIITKVSAAIYMGSAVSIDLLLAGWYIFTYKDITFGKKEKTLNCIKEFGFFFKTGALLMVSYQITQLIFAMDRQFISIYFDVKTYGIYSFSYTLLAMIISIIGSISLVLFPRLKRKEEGEIIRGFSYNYALVSTISLGALFLYSPLKVLIDNILPEYVQAIIYIKILFPSLVLTSLINIVMFTYFKVLNEHRAFFIIGIINFFCSIGLNFTAYFCFKTASAISMASITSLGIWYLICQLYLTKKYAMKYRKNTIYVLLGMLLFYVIYNGVSNLTLATLVYLVSYILLTVCCQGKVMLKFINRIHK